MAFTTRTGSYGNQCAGRACFASAAAASVSDAARLTGAAMGSSRVLDRDRGRPRCACGVGCLEAICCAICCCTAPARCDSARYCRTISASSTASIRSPSVCALTCCACASSWRKSCISASSASRSRRSAAALTFAWSAARIAAAAAARASSIACITP
eukprot:31027-Pelagococcus_subviridis.AAC.20